jgi:hypothetical protein
LWGGIGRRDNNTIQQKQQAAPPPYPSPKGRGVKCEIPFVSLEKTDKFTQANKLSFSLSSSELFPALPLSVGEGVGGVRLFFLYPYQKP